VAFGRSLLIVAAMACLAACQPPVRELAAGQVWSYDNRSGEGASTVEILHIEHGTPVGDVYFVAIRALNVRTTGRWLRSREIWPLVFTHDALKASLRNYQWEQKVEHTYLKQLDFWLREARAGRAAERTFNVPVKEALDQIESERPGTEKRLFGDSA